MRHSLLTIFDTKLEIFLRAFFDKNHYWNLNLSIVALSGLKKITKKMGASSKMIKILHIAIDTKKNIEKGELKMKSIRKI